MVARKMAIALLLASASGQAWAQTPPEITADDANADATTSESAGRDDQEIIVTAQKRSESLSTVPIAITALTGDMLNSRGIGNVRDLALVTPGLLISNNGPFSQPVIRGIGSSGTNVGESANVALYVDGVYLPTQLGSVFQLADVERVEVLKGPQGTLFGRNATGGAIRIITKEPANGMDAYHSLSYGRFNEIEAKAYASVGNDRIGASISGLVLRNDGYVRDIALNRRLADYTSYAARAKLRFNPTDDLSFILAGDFLQNKTSDIYGLSFPFGNSLAYGTIPGLLRGNGPRETALSFYPFDKVKNGGVSLNANWDGPGFTVTSITAMRWLKDQLNADSDASPANLQKSTQDTKGRSFSQEINIVSAGDGSLDWLVGAFYFHNNSDGNLFVQDQPFTMATTTTDAYAIFGELTYQFTNTVSVIGGLRYSSEKAGVDTLNVPLSRRQIDSTRFNSVTPRISIRYQPNPAINAYASFSKGFKSGTYNVNDVGAPPVRPEKIDAYEIGLKTRLGSGASFNVASYYYKYADLQVQSLFGSGQVRLQNAASATIYGTDADLNIRPFEGLKLTGGLSYNHSRYDDYIAILQVPNATNSGNVGLPVDVAGNRLQRAPRFTVNVGGSYETALADGKLAISGNLFVSGKYFWEPGNRLEQPSYEVLNAQISWTTPDEHLRLTAFGRNLTNQLYQLYVAPARAGDRFAYQAPITYGIKLEYMY